MNAIIFSNLLKDQQALRNLDPDILQSLLEEYPYSQPIKRLMKMKAALTKADRISQAEQTEINHIPLFPIIPSNEMEELKTVTEEQVLVPIQADLEEEVLYFDTPDRKSEGFGWLSAAPNEITMGKKKDKKTIKKIRKEVLKNPTIDKEKIDDKLPQKVNSATQSPNPKTNFQSWKEAQPPVVDGSEEEEISIPDLGRIELSTAETPEKKKKKTSKTAKKKRIKPKGEKVKSKSGKKGKKKKKKSDEIKPDFATNTAEKSKKKTKVKHFARESVKNRPSLISETLANLLAKQGHIEKSIAMYEKLRLLIPEKSDFFASQIEKLKNI